MGGASPSPGGADVVKSEPGPGADVGRASPSPGADVGGASPVRAAWGKVECTVFMTTTAIAMMAGDRSSLGSGAADGRW